MTTRGEKQAAVQPVQTEDDEFGVLVKIHVALWSLPDNAARERVLDYFTDRLRRGGYPEVTP